MTLFLNNQHWIWMSSTSFSFSLSASFSCSHECNRFIDNYREASTINLVSVFLKMCWYNEARQSNVFPGLANNKSNKKNILQLKDQLDPASSLISRNFSWARRWALYTLALSVLQSTLQPVLFPYSPIKPLIPWHLHTFTPIIIIIE